MEYPSHKKIAQFIDPEMMAWVLDNALDPETTVALCRACALDAPKTTGPDLPKGRPVAALVHAFSVNDEVAQKIVESLAEVSRDEMRACQSCTIEEVEARTADRDRLLSEGRAGRLMFALAGDSRLKVNLMARGLFEALDGRGGPGGEPGGVPNRCIEETLKDNERLRREMDRIRERLEGLSRSVEGSRRFLEAFSESVTEIKSLVTREIIDNGRERNEVRRIIEELRNELRVVGAETHVLVEAGRKPGRAPGDADRVGIFVDVQNIFYAAKQFNARLDFEKLLRTASGGRRFIRAIAYVVQSPEVDQTGFITMLQQKNYEVKRMNLRLRSDGSAKGDWDMGMAIDIIDMAGKLDVVVLVSGDGDFVSLVNLVKTMGPRVEVYSFPHNTARDLIQAADRHVPIDESLLMRVNGDFVMSRQQREAAEAGSPAGEPARMGEAPRVAEAARAAMAPGPSGSAQERECAAEVSR